MGERFGTRLFQSTWLEMVGGFLRLGVPVVFARALGDVSFGQLSVLLAITLIGFNLGCAGMPASASYFVSRHRDVGSARRVVVLGAITSSLTVVVGLPAVLWYAEQALPDVATWIVLSAVVTVVPYTIENVSLGILRGQLRVIVASVGGLVRNFATVVIGVILYAVAWDLEFAVVALFALAAMLSMVLWIAIRQGATEIQLLQPPSPRVVLGYGLRTQLPTLIVFLNYRLDVIALGSLMQTSDVAVYVAAVTLAEATWFPSQVVASGLLGRLSAEEDDQRRAGMAERYCRLVVAATVASALLVAMGGGLALSVLFGESYSAGYRALLLVLVGVVALAPSRILATHRSASGHPEANAAGSAMGLAVNVLGLVVLVPRFGIEGAALSTTASYSMVLAERVLSHRRLGHDADGILSSLFLVRPDDLALVRSSLPRRFR